MRVSQGPAQTPASGHSVCYLGMDFPSRGEGCLLQDQKEGAGCLQKHSSASSALRTLRSSLSHGCNLFSRVKSFSSCSSPPSLLANRLVQCTVDSNSLSEISSSAQRFVNVWLPLLCLDSYYRPCPHRSFPTSLPLLPLQQFLRSH